MRWQGSNKDDDKKKNRKKKAKKMLKDQDLNLLTEYAMSIPVKYSSDTQICDINKQRILNNEQYRQKFYCSKQLMNQNKNIIVSTNGPNNLNSKENFYAPVIYE
jgi:hypothetical protein